MDTGESREWASMRMDGCSKSGDKWRSFGGNFLAYFKNRSSKGLGPENYLQGSRHAVRRFWIGSRHGCIEGRVNVLLSFPLVRAVSLARVSKWVLHSPTYSWDAEVCAAIPSSRGVQGKMRENGQLGTCHHGMGVTTDRRLRGTTTLHWGRYQLGLLSVTFSFCQDGGLVMCSQASVMPVNTGDSAAHVIEESEK